MNRTLTYYNSTTKETEKQDFGTEKKLMLKRGEYTLILSKSGYKTIQTKIDVSVANTLFEGYELEEIKQKIVAIKSNPSGASIYMNSELIGATDNDFFLYPGEYDLKLEKDDYISFEKQVVIEERKENSFDFDMTKNASYLEVVTMPKDVEILVDGQDRTLNKENIEVYPGDHTIELVKRDYIKKEIKVNLKLSERIKLEEELIKNRGFLTLQISPTNTIIKINKVEYKEKNTIELPPGEHQISISKQGYLPYDTTINLKLGEKRDLEVNLSQNVAYLDILIEPKDARFFLNNTEYETNRVLLLPPGSYKMEITKDGYDAEEKIIQLTLHKTQKQQITLKKRIGTLQIKVDKGLKVNFDLKQNGKKIDSWKGSNIIDLIEGTYLLEGYLKNYNEYKQVLKIRKNETESLDVNMTKGYINLVSPKNKSTKKSTNIKLSWKSNLSLFDIYIDENKALEKEENKINSPKKVFEINDLDYSTTYFWKVIGKYDDEELVESDVWSFKTKSGYSKKEVNLKLSETKNQFKYIWLSLIVVNIVAWEAKDAANTFYGKYEDADNVADAEEYRELVEKFDKKAEFSFKLNIVPLIWLGYNTYQYERFKKIKNKAKYDYNKF